VEETEKNSYQTVIFEYKKITVQVARSWNSSAASFRKQHLAPPRKKQDSHNDFSIVSLMSLYHHLGFSSRMVVIEIVEKQALVPPTCGETRAFLIGFK
jgi:hypothetical protein